MQSQVLSKSKSDQRNSLILDKDIGLPETLQEINNLAGDNQGYNCSKGMSGNCIDGIDGIIVSDPGKTYFTNKLFEQTAKSGIKILFLSELAEQDFKQIPEVDLKLCSDHYIILLSSKFNKMKIIRVLDILLSLIMSVFILLPLLCAMLYILIKDGLPIIYIQERIGYMGRSFKLFKLRTYDDWQDEENNIKTLSTQSGFLLRKYRLNEVPQLLNVFRGEMSLVGSRPDIYKDFYKNMETIPFYFARYFGKPGVTGYAQVNYGYCTTEEDFRKRLEYDLYQLKHYSVRLYLSTLLKTVKTVILGVGK